MKVGETKPYNNLIFGISTTFLTEPEKEFFLKSCPLGIILFSRNIESREQLKDLTNSIKILLPWVKIFIDQEGGRVNRLKTITENDYKASEHFSNLYKKNEEEAKKAVRENYSKIMKELNSLGIDSPCAPVCDLYYENSHKVIGDRSFGDNVTQVVELTKEAIAGINSEGGIAFIKHIPGHGRANVDSHLSLPIIDASLKELEQTDFKVFKELRDQKAWAMTAHIIYKCLDSEKPATLSKKVIDYIKNDIGFKGKIVTDDICMKALHEKGDVLLESFTSITKNCFAAGCDIILHCSGNIDEMEATYKGSF